MKINVCIVTFPLLEAGYTPLSNLVKLFSRLANRVYVISGGEGLEKLKLDATLRVTEVTHSVSSNLLMKIINYLHTQFKILRCVIEASRSADLFVFFIGGEDLILPISALKLLRKKVLVMPGAITTRIYSFRMDPLSKFLALLTTFNIIFVDKLIFYSLNMIREANLAEYHRKVIIAHEHFVDFAEFVMKNKIDERTNVVGYIGRLSEEKGILNLIDAMPLISKEKTDVSFSICGDGSLTDEVRKSIKANGLEAITELTKWIPHEDVPRYLNKLKLLVLPSFTEGLPNILLEAMACGTPILATSVGAVPDIIKDGETGFLLKSNDPKHIADKIVELLNEQQLLEEVSQNAYKWVRESFSKEETLRIWQRILSQFEIS